MQWAYDFRDEFRWASRVFRALPREFSPDPPLAEENIAEWWRAFQQAPAAISPPNFMLNRERRMDRNLQSIVSAYGRALDTGVPLRFTLAGAGQPAARAIPIRALGGYQLSYLGDTAHRTWIAYLRSRQVRKFGNTYLGVPVEAPLRLRFDLPDGDYNAELIDLSRNRARHLRITANSEITVSPKTQADYVLVVTTR
jgi:hypothetical protein